MDNIRTGQASVKPEAPAHTAGTKEGNQVGTYKKMPGHLRDDRSSARRSTGVRRRSSETIVPGSPNLSPV